MGKPPRRPREIKRATGAQDSAVRGRAIAPGRRPSKQPELFDEPLPPFVEPCLATLKADVPAGDKWVHEIKWDGYRLMIRIEDGDVGDVRRVARILAGLINSRVPIGFVGARDEDAAGRAATLREALALWRGAPLADFEYESFVQAEAARLGELRQQAVEGRIEAELDLGGGAEVVAELQALVAAHPLQ